MFSESSPEMTSRKVFTSKNAAQQTPAEEVMNKPDLTRVDEEEELDLSSLTELEEGIKITGFKEGISFDDNEFTDKLK